MTFIDFLFYFFSLVLVSSCAFVISARNQVHSVLFLILAFFNAAGLLVLIGAEFMAMMFVIVYVGAVAVLFLFVIMMLESGQQSFQGTLKRYTPAALFVGVILLLEGGLYLFSSPASGTAYLTVPQASEDVSNAAKIGLVLYSEYFVVFQVVGLILLVAMIAAIVLTLQHAQDTRRQQVHAQVSRDPKKSVVLVDVTPKGGDA